MYYSVNMFESNNLILSYIFFSNNQIYGLQMRKDDVIINITINFNCWSIFLVVSDVVCAWKSTNFVKNEKVLQQYKCCLSGSPF